MRQSQWSLEASPRVLGPRGASIGCWLSSPFLSCFPGSYECGICGKKYKYYNCFQTHVRAHRGECYVPPAEFRGHASLSACFSARAPPPDSEEERSILLYMGECTGVGGCRTCYQASATKAPCLLHTGLLPPRVRHCCPVSFHVLPMMGLEWQQVAVSILKMRTLKLRGQEGWRLTLPEPGWQGGKALGQGLD